MTDKNPEKPELPFRNRFLISGYVHGHNKWWMYFAGVAAVFLGYACFQIIISVPLLKLAESNGLGTDEILKNPSLLFDPDKVGINRNLMLALLLGMFVFAWAGLYTVVTGIHRKPFSSIITGWEKFRWKRLFFGFAVWGALMLVQLVVGYLLDPGDLTLQFDPPNFLLLLLVSITLLPIQTSTEEFIFRGYLAQGFSQLFKNGLLAMITTSVMFGLLHMDNPEAKAHGWLIMLPYYSMFGLFLGILTLLDEGMELALGVHCANNMLSSLLVTTPNSVIKTDALFVTENENPALEMAVWFVFALITFTIFWLKYRWKNFNLILK